MDEPYLAAIRGKTRDFKWLFSRVGALAIRGQRNSAEIYLEIHRDKIEAFDIRSSPEQSYCTFSASYFDGITLGEDRKVTACVNAVDVLDILTKCDGNDFIELRFLDDVNATEGSIEPPRPSILRVRGGLTHQVMCPIRWAEDKDPAQLRQRFTKDDRLMTADGSKTVPVHINIPADQVDWFTSIIDGDDDSEVYPLVVRDEQIEFTFFPEDDPEVENWVHGELSTHSTEGPDIKQHYPKYIGPIFRMLSGDIDLYTDPEEGLLAVVNKEKMGSTLRYVVRSVDIDIDDSPLKWV
jgi:hypothetical protein